MAGSRQSRTGRAAPELPLAVAVVLVAGALSLAPDRPLRAQEEGEEPAMAEAPRQFRVGATGGALLWDSDPDRTLDDGALWGVSLERLLVPYASVRLGGAFRNSSIRSGGELTGLNTYLAELLVAGRVAPPALRRAGVIPFGTAGLGTVIHEPERDGLTTRSQNAVIFGAGLEVTPLSRLGARAEWRRYDVDLENVFDPLDRTGRGLVAQRLMLTLFWTF